MTHVMRYLEETVKKYPNKTAFTDGDAALTFASLRDKARSVGSFLAAKGHIGIPVVVMMNRKPDTIAAFFGVVYGGCAYVPVDPEMSLNRIEGIFNDLKPRVVICQQDTRGLLERLPFDGTTYDFDDMAAFPQDDEILSRLMDTAIDADLLYIVYTSGSTGAPKGVAACHRSVIDYIEALCPVLGVNEHTVFGNQTPLYVDACLKELYPTVKHGATTFLIPKELFMFPVKLTEYLNRYEINTICWVVSALTIVSGMGALERTPPRFLKTIAFGSEAFPRPQLDKWLQALPDVRFINLYGPTECTGMSCYYELCRPLSPDEPVPIGKPFPNTHILLLDGDTLVSEQGGEGEICIRGTALTLGYYNDFARTEEVFVQNPLNPYYREWIYRTGDIGTINAHGELVFLSRRDHQIKHMGHRIELGEIESAAAAFPGVVMCACVYDTGRKRIALYYSGEAATEALAAHLGERLPRFMQPSRMNKLDALPLTPNGKIDRPTLLRMLTEGR